MALITCKMFLNNYHKQVPNEHNEKIYGIKKIN